MHVSAVEFFRTKRERRLLHSGDFDIFSGETEIKVVGGESVQEFNQFVFEWAPRRATENNNFS